MGGGQGGCCMGVAARGEQLRMPLGDRERHLEYRFLLCYLSVIFVMVGNFKLNVDASCAVG